MNRTKVFMYDQFAGILTEDENGYTFVYDPAYLASEDAEVKKMGRRLTHLDVPRYGEGTVQAHDGVDEDGGVNGLPYPKKSQIGGGYLMSIRSAGIRWDRAWRP